MITLNTFDSSQTPAEYRVYLEDQVGMPVKMREPDKKTGRFSYQFGDGREVLVQVGRAPKTVVMRGGPDREWHDEREVITLDDVKFYLRLTSTGAFMTAGCGWNHSTTLAREFDPQMRLTNKPLSGVQTEWVPVETYRLKNTRLVWLLDNTPEQTHEIELRKKIEALCPDSTRAPTWYPCALEVVCRHITEPWAYNLERASRETHPVRIQWHEREWIEYEQLAAIGREYNRRAEKQPVWAGIITVNPEQCGGSPCIRGMRIRVKDVVALFKLGLVRSQVRNELPDLTDEDVKAVWAYYLDPTTPLP